MLGILFILLQNAIALYQLVGIILELKWDTITILSGSLVKRLLLQCIGLVVLDRVHGGQLVQMLLILQTLLLLMIQILLMDNLILLLQLEYLSRVHLSVVSTAFHHLSAIIGGLEQFNVFHFTVIS